MRTLKNILALTALTFGLLIGSQGIAYGQFLIQDNDSCICYTTNQDKRALECLKTSISKDSLIQIQSLKILNYKNVVSIDRNIISLNETMIDDQKKSINKLNLKLEVSKKLTIIGVPTAVIAGFIAGYIISK